MSTAAKRVTPKRAAPKRVERPDAKAKEYLGLRIDGDLMGALRDFAANERKPVSVVVRDMIIARLRASDFNV